MMNINLEDERVQIFYSETMRRYYINVIDQNKVSATQALFYCPWCSMKLPKSLNKKYYEILENEYYLDVDDIYKGVVPEEFKSDEWWKKRGL